MKVTVDGREVEEFEKTLATISGPALLRDVTAVVEKGAVNIKKDAAKRISGLAHARAYPNSITYDMRPMLAGPAAEIGPDKTRKQGPLGNILEYGTVNNPPHPHIRPAADAELPKFAAALEALAVKQLEGQ